MSTKRTPGLVSVIIPAFNSAQDIKRILISIKHQTYKNIEIIVVDDASTDRTLEIAKKYTDKAFRREHKERSVQRNFGVSMATGKYLLLLDSDMELSKGVVDECVRLAMNNKKVGAIAIPELSITKTYWERVKGFERSFYNEFGDKYTDAARFFTKAAFSKVGGYDESITGPEDWDLPDRIKNAGYKIGRVKSSLNHYEKVSNPFVVAKKKFYYGLKSYRYFEKNKMAPIGPKTIYFLRPVFYRKWKKIVSHPILSLSMFFMLTLEQFAGGLGYLIGRTKRL